MKICRHYNICGGCKIQDLAYQKQLKLKTSLIKERADKYGVKIKRRLKKIIASPLKYNYRNKMEFTFYAEDDGGVCLGLHGTKKIRRVVELKECRLAGDEMISVLQATLRYARSKNLKGYHRFRHKGYLRHLIIRKSFSDKELMVIIVTTSKGRLDRNAYLKTLLRDKALKKTGYKIASVYHVVNDLPADAVNFQKQYLVYGRKFLKEKVKNITYRIYNQSFFQTNSKCLRRLYDAASGLIEPKKGDKVLDLFCGAGGIGLYIAKKVEEVVGIEINKQAIKKAHENMRINSLSNMEVINSDVRTALRENKEELIGKFNKVIIDPPRAGITKRVFEHLIELNIPRVIYISCNPDSLFDNARLFIEDGYKLKTVQPVDMFPHTKHVETAVLLEKKPEALKKKG
jgi:23S rRNA (uracil-5-)-methyltransferase RumA